MAKSNPNPSGDRAASGAEVLRHTRLIHRARKDPKRLEGGRQALLKTGPPRHAVAISVDLCQANARWINDVSQRAIQRTLTVCRGQKGLDREMKNQLKHLKTKVSWQPETAPIQLAAFRKSFIVPVPGLLGELVLPSPAPREKSLAGEG